MSFETRQIRFLRLLSTCVEAVQSMLYPFVWQHTLVPVLPGTMSEIASAPTPYVMGLLQSTAGPNCDHLAPEDGLLVDLDAGQVTLFLLLFLFHPCSVLFYAFFSYMQSTLYHNLNPLLFSVMNSGMNVSYHYASTSRIPTSNMTRFSSISSVCQNKIE